GDPPLAVTVDVPGLDLAPLADSAPLLRGVRGRLAGHVEITGTWRHPTGRGELGVAGASVDDIAFRELRARGEARARALQRPATAAAAKGGAVTVKGRLALGGAHALEAHLEGDGVDVAFARPFLPGVREISGALRARVDVRGTLAAPEPSGSLSLQGGRLGL